MISRLLISLFISLLLGNRQTTSQTIVTVNVSESIVYVERNIIVPIWVTVKEGYHIQANKVDDENLIPTKLEIKNDTITINKQEFPASKKFKLEGTGTFLQVYDGRFQVRLFLSPESKAVEGKYILKASLRYQACDSNSCLFPRVVDFSIPIEVKKTDR